jgi:acetylserotonin N-methyltransferase
VEADLRLGRPDLLALFPRRSGQARVSDGDARLRIDQLAARHLGGATGHLAIAACERWPQLEAVVFDLPEAVPLAQEIVGASGIAKRIRIDAGDFFADPLPEGDLFALGRILHDWTEEKIHKLLGKIHERLPSGGALLIAEKLLADDKTGPSWARLQDLNMLTCTEGRERTLGEYESLLRRVGFTTVTGRRTDSPLDAVLAVKE